MNERYPDATPAEIRNEDVCIICREGMTAWSDGREQPGPPLHGAPAAVDPHMPTDERLRPKRLPCGHILHFACLRSWLERQQNCPTCRRPVLVTPQTARSPLAQLPNGNVNVNGQANARNPGAPTQAVNRQVGADQNRVRVFNFGPFRVGFGAGQDIQGLAQHLNDQPQPENRQAPAPAGGIVPQLGFGLRFGRQVPSSQVVARAGQNGVQAQLQHIEQYLMHEINTLRVQADQLSLVRALQGELARLRIAQAHANASHNEGTAGAGQIRNPALATNNVPPFMPTHRPTVHAFAASEQQQLGTGDQGLPPGLSIPEGWTLLPLHRLPSNTTVLQQPAALPPDSMNLTRNNAFAAEARATPDISTGLNSGQAPTDHAVPGGSNPGSVENARANGMATESCGPSVGQAPPLSSQEPQPDPSVEVESSSSHSEPQPVDQGRAEKLEEERADGPSTSPPRWGSGPAAKEMHATKHRSKPPSSAAFHWDADGEPTASSVGRKVEKGKGKATTVEDASEDVD